MDFQRKEIKRGTTTVTAFLIAFAVVVFAPVQGFAQAPFQLDGNAESNPGIDWETVNDPAGAGDGARA
jgi:hypothetical protein